MSTTDLRIRKSVMRAYHGDAETLTLADVPDAEAYRQVIAFARAKRLAVAAEQLPGGGIVIRKSDAVPGAGSLQYAELDRLGIGESRVFDVSPALHYRVRVAASQRNRRGEALLTCRREADAIRVTRMPATEDERRAFAGREFHGIRASKWGLERLADAAMLTIADVPRSQRANLRMAVSRFAARKNWVLRCRLTDDGSMQVYRLNEASAHYHTINGDSDDKN